MLVDSHCHLNYLDAPQQRLAAARARGVAGVLCIGVDEPGISGVLELALREPDVWASVGQHPESAVPEPRWIEGYLTHPSVVALGEMGLDYYQDPEAATRAAQQACFDYQLHLASRHALPVIVHTRAAESDTLAALRRHPDVVGVLHCFTESWDMAAAAIELGYYISISGIVTFRNGDNVRDVARRVPLERLLVETDAPWLAPVPHRGRPNEPAFVVETATAIAELRGLGLEELGRATTANFRRLFGRAVPAA